MGRAVAATPMLLLLAAAPLAGARGPDTTDGASPWQAAIEAYAASGAPDALLPVLTLSPDEVRAQSRHALVAWAAAGRQSAPDAEGQPARATARRRVAAAAAAPFELLLPMSARTSLLPLWDALEDAALAAAREVPSLNRQSLRDVDASARRTEDQRLARATAWWRAAHLQYLLNTRRLHDFRRAFQGVPDDADPALRSELALLRGMVEETSARLVEESTPGRLAMRPPNMRQLDVTQFFDRATTWYRRALAATPAHREARLHLGRVLLERQQPQEAVRTLASLTRAPCLDAWCGQALLFIGEAHEAMAAPARAADSYARASSAVAVRQSAIVALMHLALRRGDVPAAHALTGQFISTAPLARLDAPDAWAIYIAGRRLDAEAVLAPLRRASLP